MPWSTPREWAAGELVTAAIMNQFIRDNQNQLRTDSLAGMGLAGRYMGGMFEAQMTDAAFTIIPAGCEVTIDGGNVSDMDLELMSYVDAGTGQVRIYNVTTAAQLGSAQNITATSSTRHLFTAYTPTAGVNVYRIEALRGTTWIRVWGAQLIPG